MKNIKNYNQYSLNENEENNNVFKGDVDISSDWQGRNLLISRNEKGLLYFEFDYMGWLFDTTDVAEGVAILRNSHYKDDEDLKKLHITDVDRNNVNVKDALYWLSGGSKEWTGNTTFTVEYHIVQDQIVEKFGEEIKEMVNDSDNIGELLSNYKHFDPIDIYYFLDELGYVYREDEN